MSELCHCGQPLHYTECNTEAMMNKLIAEKGRYVNVVCEGIKYKVDRHYIALHGLKGKDLPILGFEVIENVKTGR